MKSKHDLYLFCVLWCFTWDWRPFTSLRRCGGRLAGTPFYTSPLQRCQRKEENRLLTLKLVKLKATTRVKAENTRGRKKINRLEEQMRSTCITNVHQANESTWSGIWFVALRPHPSRHVTPRATHVVLRAPPPAATRTTHVFTYLCASGGHQAGEPSNFLFQSLLGFFIVLFWVFFAVTVFQNVAPCCDQPSCLDEKVKCTSYNCYKAG